MTDIFGLQKWGLTFMMLCWEYMSACFQSREEETIRTKKGLIKGSAITTSWFQSKVGRGFNPRPVTLPVIAASLEFPGEIQVIQLKYDIAWSTKSGNQK